MLEGRMLKKRKIIPLDIKLFIIKRDKNTCQYCGKKGTFIFRFGKPCVVENPNNKILFNNENYNDKDLISFEIDHILPICCDGENDINNLILSCRKCNRGKANREKEWYKQWQERG